jgi:formylglycine-generating enzyme required for sulfatase activity
VGADPAGGEALIRLWMQRGFVPLPTLAGSERLSTISASAFAPTIPNKPAPAVRAGGHGLDSGGEFSMGSDAASESLCGLPGVTRDALPIHRVYVDGFWMDATEVTNEQFENS